MTFFSHHPSRFYRILKSGLYRQAERDYTRETYSNAYELSAADRLAEYGARDYDGKEHRTAVCNGIVYDAVERACESEIDRGIYSDDQARA